MTAALRLPSPIEAVSDPGLGEATFNLILKRDDLISSVVAVITG